MSYRIRQSICNEVFEGWEFEKTCEAAKAAGYDGIEIAPFTLAETPGKITAARRRKLKKIMAGSGLEFVGLHWLMVSPKGLHVTTPDAALYKRSWTHIKQLIDLAPQRARLKVAGEGEREVAIAEVQTGDIVIVRPGERIPVDGTITFGCASINEAPITGESLPVEKGFGEAVYAGSVNAVVLPSAFNVMTRPLIE